MSKKLIVGITAAGSVGLLPGQLSYFKEKGYKTFLLAPRTERSVAYCAKEGCELLAVEMKREISPFHDFVAFFKILFIFIKIRPDIVNLGTPKVSLLGLAAAFLIGVKKRIYTCRGLRYEHEIGKLKIILLLMEKITSFCAHEVNCISNSVRELGIKDGIFSKEKSSVIEMGSSNGINLNYFSPQAIPLNDKLKLKNQLQLNGYFIFGFLGRIIDRKGISELVEAFNVLYKKDNNIRLLIVGPIEESQIKNTEIIDLIKTHEGIIWPGRTDNVPLYLSIMDVFVLPAWWEGFGNVLVQAAAMGIPVISTTGTGTIDAVKNEFNGLLVPVKNVNELLKSMNFMYQNEESRLNMGKNGLLWARNFENSIIWKGLDKLYNR
jgi:glycosyltransferase involved in cell wall biosynthesis